MCIQRLILLLSLLSSVFCWKQCKSPVPVQCSSKFTFGNQKDDIKQQVANNSKETKIGFLRMPNNPYGFQLQIDRRSLDSGIEEGKKKMKNCMKIEQDLLRRKVYVSSGSPGSYHSGILRPRHRSLVIGHDTSEIVLATQSIVTNLRLTPNQARLGMSAYSIKETKLANICPKKPSCDPKARYRTIDGSCNNLKHPLWGRRDTPFQRLLHPAYSDGVMEPRVAVSGQELPSSRLVSTTIIADMDRPSKMDTHNLMQWGQFIDHDITFTPVSVLSDEGETGIQCCSQDGSSILRSPDLHPHCFPIHIPASDPFFHTYNQRCMNFVRSMLAPNPNCTFGYGEQMNQITHFHDASNVYGSEQIEAGELRERTGGLMKVSKSKKYGSKGLLPESIAHRGECDFHNFGDKLGNHKCFFAGDTRANEHTGLTAFHTVWMREHNRLASLLENINPHWEDERLYQEARRIVTAEMQHITYTEWLPIVLGKKRMGRLDILQPTRGYTNHYNSSVNPSIINSFATAAFRFGHSLIQGSIELMEEHPTKPKWTEATHIPLAENFFKPELMTSSGSLDRFLRGLTSQPSQTFDRGMSKSLTNHLFQGTHQKFGLDLVALNIQRGRDHGLPSYPEYRELCGLGKVDGFHSLLDDIPESIVRKLRSIYSSVRDIDLFIGGISERPVEGSIVGPTFQCILGDMFKRLQFGDRYFYSSSSHPAPFSPSQLDELRKSSLARVTCDNGDRIQHLQREAFRTVSHRNPLVPCNSSTIPRMSLLPWKEEPTDG